MKFSTVAFLAAAGLAAAQDPSTCTDDILAFPFCGFSVISSTASSLGCTDFNDPVCLCSSSAAIVSALSAGTDFSSQCSELGDPSSDSELSAAYSTLCACVSNTALPTSTSTVEATTTTDAGSSSSSSGSSGSSSSSAIVSVPSIGSSLPVVSLPTSSLPISVPTSGITTPGVSPTVKPSGSGAPTKSLISVSHFTGAAATAGTFLPVGGLFGAVVGLLAYL